MCLKVLMYTKEVILTNTKHITNYKPKDFAELLGVSVKTLQCWDRDNILKAKTGALIAVLNSEELSKIIDGGFNINEDFTPAAIYELAKMDGAIILSQDMKKILKKIKNTPYSN